MFQKPTRSPYPWAKRSIFTVHKNIGRGKDYRPRLDQGNGKREMARRLRKAG